MTNWKTTGPDCVQGYWFKGFSRFQSSLTEHLETCVVVVNVPTWMTKENSIDPEGSKERKCCQQLPPFCMPSTYVEAADQCLGRKGICTPI